MGSGGKLKCNSSWTPIHSLASWASLGPVGMSSVAVEPPPRDGETEAAPAIVVAHEQDQRTFDRKRTEQAGDSVGGLFEPAHDGFLSRTEVIGELDDVERRSGHLHRRTVEVAERRLRLPLEGALRNAMGVACGILAWPSHRGHPRAREARAHRQGALARLGRPQPIIRRQQRIVAQPRAAVPCAFAREDRSDIDAVAHARPAADFERAAFQVLLRILHRLGQALGLDTFEADLGGDHVGRRRKAVVVAGRPLRRGLTRGMRLAEHRRA